MEVTCFNNIKKILRMIKKRIPTHLLTLLIKEVKTSVEQGRVVTTLRIIKQ